MLIKFTKELNEIEVCIITIARRIAMPAGSSCSEFNETIETVSFICQFEVVRDVWAVQRLVVVVAISFLRRFSIVRHLHDPVAQVAAIPGLLMNCTRLSLKPKQMAEHLPLQDW